MTDVEAIEKMLKKADIPMEKTDFKKESEIVIQSGGLDTHILFTFKNGNLKDVTSDCFEDLEAVEG